MTEIDINNYEIIDKLVKYHFNLSSNGYKDFHNLLWNKNNERIIDPILKDLLGKDLRYSISLSEDMYPAIDEGWELFQESFRYMLQYSDIKIKYKNYKENSINYKKNKLKLFKAVKKYYKEDETALRQFVYNNTNSYFDKRNKEEIFDEAFEKIINEIGTKKIPNKDMTIVLSLNFADWFLCSTSENWGSCLNLESNYESAFWAGLPGLIGDPNRMMFYITNGQKKFYNGIETESITARTWGILTEKNNIYPVLSYPVELLEKSTLSKVFKDFSFLDEEDKYWISKYPLKIIRNTFGQSSFIYQDNSIFLEEDGEYYLEGNNGGASMIEDSGYISEGSSYFYEDGLKNLISRSEDISNYNEESNYCEICNERISEDEMFSTDNGSLLCGECFSDNYTYCENCNTIVENEEIRGVDNELLCEDCFNDKATYCEDCGNPVKHDDAIINASEEPICSSCLIHYTECKTCEEFVKTNDLNDEGICSYCEEQGEASGL